MAVPEHEEIRHTIRAKDSQEFNPGCKFLEDFRINQKKLRKLLQEGKLMYMSDPEGRRILTYVKGKRIIGEKKQNEDVKLYYNLDIEDATTREILIELMDLNAFSHPIPISKTEMREIEKLNKKEKGLYNELTKYDEDIQFLLALDKQLHYKEEKMYLGHIVELDSYHEWKMTHKEAEKMMEVLKKLIEKKKVVFYPINTACGFAVGFSVDEIEGFYPLCKKGKVLLRLKESQLPKEYNFDKLSEIFLSNENLRIAKHLGIEISENRWRYEY